MTPTESAPKHTIVSLDPLKREFAQRIQEGRGIYTPLELYLHPVWQRLFDPLNTVYVTAAASRWVSGLY